jgi:magnesium transporter
MKNPILIPEFRELLEKEKYSVLKSFLEEGHSREMAELLEMLDPDEIWRILKLLDNYLRCEIFSYFDIDVQKAILAILNKRDLSEILIGISPDNRADFFQHLDKETANRYLIVLPIRDRANIIKLTSYDEETAGAIMTTDYATLNENDTVEESIKLIRKIAPSKETIYYIYVVDDSGGLIGFVSLRKLILAKPKKKISKLMKTEVLYAGVDDDKEDVAQLIEEYDLIALPIVDSSQRLMGIVTHDDAIDIIREEETEDLEKLMAISGGVEEKAYLDVPALVHFRKRAFWVLTLGIFGLLTALIVEFFRDTLEALIILTFYIPMLNAAGGNTGSQSATVILRSLTLNELTPGDVVKVIQKEFIISLCLSICLGAIVFFRVYYFPIGDDIPVKFTLTSIATVISISLGLQVLWSTIFGAIVPIAATKLKVDPAVVSSPLLTTFVDMGGIVIYFSVAKIVLGI